MPIPVEHLVPDDLHRCRFVKTSGARCTTPALHAKELCFDHHRRLLHARGRLRTTTPSTFNLIPLVAFAWAEDHHSILFNLNQIADALTRGVIDARQAGAMTSLMRTCLKTLRQRHELEKPIETVSAYVDQDGLTLTVPDGVDPLAAPEAPEAKTSHYEGQRLLWQYFRNDPESGVPSGLDINWPGRPADFHPREPAANLAGPDPAIPRLKPA